MLLLTRRIGESFLIGDDITVMILGRTGNQIRVGIDAPREINIARSELIEKDHG